MNERDGTMVHTRSEALTDRYLELARDWSLWQQPLDATLQQIAESVSVALEVARVGVWRLQEDAESLSQIEQYDSLLGRHSCGERLVKQRYPRYFCALSRERQIDVYDASRDSRTTEFAADYLPAHGIGALLDTAINTAGTLYGVICVEHVGGPRSWTISEQRFAVSVADLLAQLLVYNELRVNEQHFRTLANSAPVGIVRVDEHGNCLYVNPRWCELAGLSAEKAIGYGWLEAVHPDDRERVLMVSRGGVHGTRELALNYRFRAADGQVTWLACRYVATDAADGSSQGTLGTITDITAQKRSESELRELTVLQQSILDATNHCIITTDSTGLIRSFNSAAEKMLGRLEQEVVGRVPLGEIIDPAALAGCDEQCDAVPGRSPEPGVEMLLAKPRLGVSDGREYAFCRPDGSVMPLELSVTALDDQEDGIGGYLVIGADISDRKRAEFLAKREQELILQITRGLSGTIGDQFFQNLTAALSDALGVAVAFIAEKLPLDEPTLRTIAINDPGASEAGAVFHFSTSIFGGNADDGIYYCPSGLQSVFPDNEKVMLLGADCYMGAELTASDGRVLGLMGILHTGPLADVALADHLIRIFAVRATSELERRIQDRAIRESERRYRALFDGSGDAIFIMQEDRFVDCNDMTLRIFGCTREQIIGASPYRFSPGFQPGGRSSRKEALEKIRRAFAGENITFDWRHSRYDGTTFDAEVTLACVDLGGDPFLLATVRDISIRKRSEAALESSSRQLAETNRRLRWINDVSVGLHSARDIDVIASHSMEMLARLSPVTRMVFCIRDAAENQFRVVATHGFNADKELPTVKTVPSAPFCELLEQGDDLMIWNDPVADFGNMPEIRNALIANRVVTLAVVQLRYDGDEYGLIVLEYDTHYEFDAIEIDTFRAFGRTVSLAVANAIHIGDLDYQANHDSLTKLYNRAALHREFQRRLRYAQSLEGLALMLLDLDRFKEINDTLGHHLGDRLLCQIGGRLEEGLGKREALLCRLGGDEFCVLLAGIADAEQAYDVARSLIAQLKKPFAIDGLTLEISGSIGIALFPQHGEDSHELLRSADVAMYESKRGGAGAVVYDRELDTHTPERLAIIADLGTAIREHQLELHYQPKLDLASGGFIGFEALVRWQHPRLGLLLPGAFIPLAEMSESIHALTREVLDLALHRQRQWQEQGLRYSLAVNLSARSLIDDQCVDYLHELFARYGTDPALLELEITETALMQDPTRAAQLLDRMAALGVTISIDDFGTGYSSLAYLRRLPISALKIDQTFVRHLCDNEQDSVIVRSTIDLAHNLNLKVVAEGVEDSETLDLLRLMGCDEAQGYLLGRPLDPVLLEDWLAQQDSRRLRAGT